MDGKPYYEPSGEISQPKRDVFGVLAGAIAATAFHPLDRIKARMQVYPKKLSPMCMAREIVRCEGYLGLYRGLTAALARQATNAGVRFIVYNWLYDRYKLKYDTSPSVREKLLIGAVAGMAGAAAGNPSEVVLVRLVTSSSPQSTCLCTCMHIRGATILRHPYGNAFDAVIRIVREEGVRSLWRGGTLTGGRSVMISIAHISSYAYIGEAKGENEAVKNHVLNIGTIVLASLITSIFSLPIDLVKTRYQRISGTSNITKTEVLQDLIARRGVRNLWTGFIPYFARHCLHTTSSFLILGHLHRTTRRN